MHKPRLTIHKIAQVDRICAIDWHHTIPQWVLRRCATMKRAYGYLAAWQVLVDNDLHQL